MHKYSQKKRKIVISILLSIVLILLVTSIYASQTINLTKEDEQSKYDIKMAKKSYQNGDYKWATIQAYFSVYHSTQIILNRNWVLDKENAHKELSKELKLAEENGKVPENTEYHFNLARWGRINANYKGYSDQKTALQTLRIADEFIELVREKSS